MISKLKKNKTLLNTLSSLIMQFTMLINGFIIPKLILQYFGSDVNGLVSSINQFLSYISLLEGGITGVVMANLYKPLSEKNYDKVSAIVKTTNKFYIKISIIFIIYSLFLAILYPIMFKTKFSYLYVFSLVIVLSINLFIQYCFSLSLKTLLNADKKVYIVSFSQTIMIIINIILAYITLKIYPNIHFLKLITGILYILQPIIYNLYVNKHYNLTKNTKCDTKLIKSRWNGFAINIAAFIHWSTDIVILTLFTDFHVVSIYSVYALVTNGLRSIVQAISTAITPTIGHLYAKEDKSELNKKFDMYEYIIFIIVFVLFGVASLLITPFVMIYTKNITDTNYYQPTFGYLLIISEALYLIKSPHVNLAYSANKFKEITPSCYIEAITNILLSILLVKKYGLIGVTIGTIIAMLYRMIFHVYYTKKLLIFRNTTKFYAKLIVFGLTTAVSIIICNFLTKQVSYNIVSWIFHGFLYTIVFIILNVISIFIFFRNDIKKILK